MDLSLNVGGTVTHSVSFSGKITMGSPTKGGEVYFTFDPADYDSQKVRAENAIRLLEYAKYLYAHPENLPETVQLSAGGAKVKVG